MVRKGLFEKAPFKLRPRRPQEFVKRRVPHRRVHDSPKEEGAGWFEELAVWLEARSKGHERPGWALLLGLGEEKAFYPKSNGESLRGFK